MGNPGVIFARILLSSFDGDTMYARGLRWWYKVHMYILARVYLPRYATGISKLGCCCPELTALLGQAPVFLEVKTLAEDAFRASSKARASP